MEKTLNQVHSLMVASKVVEHALTTGKGHVKFTHPTGKWYILSVKCTSKDDRFVDTRLWAGKGRKPARKTYLSPAASIRLCILSRLNHGYSIDGGTINQSAKAGHAREGPTVGNRARRAGEHRHPSRPFPPTLQTTRNTTMNIPSNTKELRALAQSLGIRKVLGVSNANLAAAVQNILHARAAKAEPTFTPAFEPVPNNEPQPTNNGNTNMNTAESTATENKPSVEERAAQLTAETIAHLAVKNKSPLAVASRVARHLNKEGFQPAGRKFFTGPVVLALFGAERQVEDEQPEAEDATGTEDL